MAPCGFRVRVPKEAGDGKAKVTLSPSLTGRRVEFFRQLTRSKLPNSKRVSHEKACRHNSGWRSGDRHSGGFLGSGLQAVRGRPSVQGVAGKLLESGSC